MVDFPWDRYACLQAQLRQGHRVSDRSWGIEAGLNRILSPELTTQPPANDDIDRVVNNEERQQRHRAELRRRHLVNDEAALDPAASLQAECSRAR